MSIEMFVATLSLVYGLVMTLLFVALSIAATKERADLLNRIMARNYGEYVAVDRTVDAPETEQLTTDALEAQWYEAQAREAAARDADGAHMVGVGLPSGMGMES